MTLIQFALLEGLVVLLGLLLWVVLMWRLSARVDTLERVLDAPIANRIGRALASDLTLAKLVKTAAQQHDEYAKDRIENRKRLGFHGDQRREAIAQRVERELHLHGLHRSRQDILTMIKQEVK